MVKSVDELIDKVFENFSVCYTNRTWLCERAILAPKNVTVREINGNLLQRIPGEESIYKSIDRTTEGNDDIIYSIEVLNSIETVGLCDHEIYLKVGAPIMLLRNIVQPKMCNGTILII